MNLNKLQYSNKLKHETSFNDIKEGQFFDPIRNCKSFQKGKKYQDTYEDEMNVDNWLDMRQLQKYTKHDRAVIQKYGSIMYVHGKQLS